MPEDPRADSPCPELADLILASEGELPKRRQREVSEHVRHCSTCREALGGADRSLAEFEDALNTPQRIAAEATAAAARTAEFRVRLHDEQRTTAAKASRLSFRSWLPVAAAVPVLVAVMFMSNRYSEVVRAEELLTRAVAQEESAPADTVRRVEIRVTRSAEALATASRTKRGSWSMTREIGFARPVSSSESAANADSAEVATMMEANHFEWWDPLSVRGFRAWRDSLAHKSDSVSIADADTFALRTTTPDGTLRSAELIVRRVDFQPLRATLNFEGFGAVEIVELSRWAGHAPVVAENTAASAPVVASHEPTPEMLDEAELDVRRTLHDVGVDWNPAIAVARTGHGVEVRGRIDARHKSALAPILSRMPLVKVSLRPVNAVSDAYPPPAGDVLPKPALPGSTRAEESTSAPPRTRSLQRWLDRTFGRSERSSTFISSLTADAEQVQRRAAAFAGLAARYPDSETRRLAAPARQKLEALVDAQYREVVQAVEALDDHLTLFLGTTTRPAADVTPQPWQSCAAALTMRVDRLDQAIRDLLRESDLPLPTEIGTGHEEPTPLSNLRQADAAMWKQLNTAQPD